MIDDRLPRKFYKYKHSPVIYEVGKTMKAGRPIAGLVCQGWGGYVFDGETHKFDRSKPIGWVHEIKEEYIKKMTDYGHWIEIDEKEFVEKKKGFRLENPSSD